ncbi:hypothetical protein [uncultured Zoogloea sp.]|uniref:hypothetical protein n=1 Tax=uncultured Zoogloea sp. TaxID=160237 RepID=UPI0026249F81|nr:hypothetical protein [uncultured Zoogloea sp.]
MAGEAVTENLEASVRALLAAKIAYDTEVDAAVEEYLRHDDFAATLDGCYAWGQGEPVTIELEDEE